MSPSNGTPADRVPAAGLASGPPRSILLVAYFFPPCSDTGAHRPAALAKYLRRLGHQVTVLTTSAYGHLEDDHEMGVFRTADAQQWRARLHGRERVDSLFDADTYSERPHPLSRVIVPEPLLLAWGPFALARGLRLQHAHRFDCVITTSPPESTHFIGRALQRRGSAWVADVRDAWTFEPLREPFASSALHRLDERLERRLFGAADVVVCVSEPAADDLRRRGIANPLLVRNGADPELLAAADPSSVAEMLDPSRVSLVFTGRFGHPGRDPTRLVEGLARFAAERPEEAERLELIIAGPLTEAERRLFGRDVLPARISLVGTLPIERALALQRAADCLLVIAHPVRSQFANLKLYEYISAGPPILGLAEGTEAGSIIREIGGRPVPAADPAAIVAALGSVVRGEIPTPGAGARAEHSYPAVAERMAAALERAIAVRRAR